jgi:hypothetical protein
MRLTTELSIDCYVYTDFVGFYGHEDSQNLLVSIHVLAMSYF